MFNPIIVKHFTQPHNTGEIDNPDYVIKIGNPVCDDRIVMHVNFGEDSKVTDVKYRSYGCATSIATADIFSEYIKGKTIQEIEQLSTPKRHEMLGELEPSQHHCLDILDNLFKDVVTLVGS